METRRVSLHHGAWFAPLLCAASVAWGGNTDSLPEIASVTAGTPSGHSSPTKGCWGLGFRALQSGTGYLGSRPAMLALVDGGSEIHIRRMISDQASLGIAVSWIGGYLERSSSRNKGLIPRNDQGYGAWKVSIPVERILKRRGPLSATASLGPMYELMFEANETESLDLAWEGVGTTYTDRFDHRIGATASLGIRWEFAPGIALATSFGADAWYSFGSATSDPPTFDDWTMASTGFGTRSWFGGVGLEAWF